MVAYFIRRAADGCAVIELFPDDREETVQAGLSLIEAEILCATRIADIPRPAASPSADPKPRIAQPCRTDARQLALKF